MTAATVFKGKAPKKTDGGDYDLCPAGNHPARLVSIIDLGTQENSYGGESRKVRQVYLAWELTEQTLPGTKGNFVVGNAYTLSFHSKSALRKLAEKWRGKEYAEEEEINYGAMMGRECLLEIGHKQNKTGDKTYHHIAGISAARIGNKPVQVAPAKREPFAFEISQGCEVNVPTWLPHLYGEELKDVIRRSPEWKGVASSPDDGPPPEAAGANEAATAEEIPF